MKNHVSLTLSGHVSEQRGQLVRLMEMARRTDGFDLNRSVRARQIKGKAADGSDIKSTVIFVRTGKESVLESIENWFLERGDQKLGKQIVKKAFPTLAGTDEAIPFQSLFKKNRITVGTLDAQVTADSKNSAAFRISWQEAAEAFHAVLGTGPGLSSSPGELCFADKAIVKIRSCLGLSARSRSAEADKMFDNFIGLVNGLQSPDWKLKSFKARQLFVEQAREFCTAWSCHKAQKPERHAHTVRTYNLAVLDELVTCFKKSFPASKK